MAPRNRNRNNNQRRQQSNRMPSNTATTPRAPQPAMAAGNEARYIQNLNAPGTDNYNAQYGGGGWVNYKAGTPQSELASDDFLRAYSKATTMANRKQGMERMIGLGSESGVMGLAAQFDAEQAAQGQASTTSPTANTKSYKDIKSINQGLKLGGDNILGRREAMKIARGTGRDFDKVLTKALGRGMSIGGGAVRQSNKASGTSQLTPTIQGQQMFTSGGSDDPLAAMRRVTPGKRQMYSGTYELDGQTMPLIESRRGGVASTLGSMTAGGGDRRRNRGGKGKGRGRRGRGGAGDMVDTGTSATSTMETPMTPMEPMTPEQMQEASTIDINMPSVGADVFSSATGFRSKRSSRKRAGSTAQGLASQRINPTGGWNYRI